MLQIPAQNRDGARAIFRCRANAVVRGMNVPRSPREPESSAGVHVARRSERRDWMRVRGGGLVVWPLQ